MPDERAIWSAAGPDVEEASLVLAAVGIPHRVERAAFRWRLVVADADAERAAAALAAYEAERRRAPSDVPDEHWTAARSTPADGWVSSSAARSFA